MRHEATKVRNLCVTYPRESGVEETKGHTGYTLDTAVSPRFRAKEKNICSVSPKTPGGARVEDGGVVGHKESGSRKAAFFVAVLGVYLSNNQ